MGCYAGCGKYLLLIEYIYNFEKKILNTLITNLTTIKVLAAEREIENDDFRVFIKMHGRTDIDEVMHHLNDSITPQIDCTQCGNCCKSLMIGVTQAETLALAKRLNEPVEAVKEKYLEISEQGQIFINTMPCHFLGGTKCTIYEDRFSDCREFPHLHKDGFSTRLFSTLMNYAICPIIFNVVEQLKSALNFNSTGNANAPIS